MSASCLEMKTTANCSVQSIQGFELNCPEKLLRAKRVLLKPNLGAPYPHPVTTSLATLELIIKELTEKTSAEIIVLEGPCYSLPLKDIVAGIEASYERVQIVDVRDCPLVIESNPLPIPFRVSSFSLPRIATRCDFRISLASYKIYPRLSSLSIKNMLGLLPIQPYAHKRVDVRDRLHELGIHEVVADLYFTFPVDLAIVDARLRLMGGQRLEEYRTEDWGRIYTGSPLDVDTFILNETGVTAEYVDLIASGAPTSLSGH